MGKLWRSKDSNEKIQPFKELLKPSRCSWTQLRGRKERSNCGQYQCFNNTDTAHHFLLPFLFLFVLLHSRHKTKDRVLQKDRVQHHYNKKPTVNLESMRNQRTTCVTCNPPPPPRPPRWSPSEIPTVVPDWQAAENVKALISWPGRVPTEEEARR